MSSESIDAAVAHAGAGDERAEEEQATAGGEQAPLLKDDVGGNRGKKKKERKRGVPADLGTAMQSERTFFKWVWLGFHMGAVNTFILAFFAKSKHVFAKFLLVAVTWTIALAFVLYGVVSYYRRRRALQQGASDRFYWDNPWGPYAVAIAVTFEVLAVMVFAVVESF
mmetsp:Transcript_3072/g.9372  ORF Transcript_3072/g.9372 Transcript_3072/m.9372 type:complete len:167 (-) Transcript_3072:562-1062(-)|eukprot:CAMPEP_0198736718 /NCGR_PEP_ID=MMETSP1475-20131203/67500_1 /TAXON_ID= ORGANISM="Unidentified sp., Strain CCMP1999" /NCGR_SAMPLE_ID=MMETSP1475 /ASSEMBLY_ACC=CAM_ASM_001111 /LENGTH=166 /DNA_ID=CAMNT_0044500567 /DNA_START=211 /DNA_END=711 /DNA_ORIENTATION=+